MILLFSLALNIVFPINFVKISDILANSYRYLILVHLVGGRAIADNLMGSCITGLENLMGMGSL